MATRRAGSPARVGWVIAPAGAVLATAVVLGAVVAGASLRPGPTLDGPASAGSLDYRRPFGAPVAPLSARFIQQVLGGVLSWPAATVTMPPSGRREPSGGEGREGGSDRASLGAGPSGRRVVSEHEPTNDSPAAAHGISDLPFTARTRTGVGTRNTSEPTDCGSAGPTVWYRYSAKRADDLVAYTLGTDHAVTLGVFGEDGARLTALGCDSDAGGNAVVPFPVTEGRSYLFQIAAPTGGGKLVFNLDEHGTVTRITVGAKGDMANDETEIYTVGALSADGRFVAFTSWATNHVDDPDVDDRPCWEQRNRTYVEERWQSPWSPCAQVYVRDMDAGRTELVSRSPSGEQANARALTQFMTPDARFVFFTSEATNLDPRAPGGDQLFVHDRHSARTTWAGMPAFRFMSGTDDGRFVAFQSDRDDLVPGDTNGDSDVFVYDRWAKTYERVSVSSTGEQSEYPDAQRAHEELFSDQLNPYVSGNGRWIVFRSTAANLVPGDTNGMWDTFVHDRLTRRTERVSLSDSGKQADGPSMHQSFAHPTISEDGRYVAFPSAAKNLVEDDNDDGVMDVFVRDRVARRTYMASVGLSAATAATHMAGWVSVSRDGRYIVFEANPTTPLLWGPPEYTADVYRHDLATRTTSLITLSARGDDASGFDGRISADGRAVTFQSQDETVDGKSTMCRPGWHCDMFFIYRIAGPR